MSISFRSMYEKVNFKLLVIDLLKAAKRMYSLDELSRILDEPPSVLSRYIHGRIFPSDDKLVKIYYKLRETVDLAALIRYSIEVDKSGFLNNQALVGDTTLLRLASAYVLERLDHKVDKVLSPAADGIPFATIVAEHLRVPIVIAKTTKEVGVKKFLEKTYVSEDGTLTTYYIDKRLIKKGDRVLIVDDVLRTGRTHKCLIEMIDSAGAVPVAIVVLIAIGNKWKKTLPAHVPVDYILHIFAST